MINLKRATFLVALISVTAAAIWWEVFDSRAPATADGAIQLQAMRDALVDDAPDARPTEVGLFHVGGQMAPNVAVTAGGGFGRTAMYFTSFDVVTPNGQILIDSALDGATADAKRAQFNPGAHEAMSAALQTATLIILTHEHDDHAMGLLSQARLSLPLARAYLPSSQRPGLEKLAGTHARRALANVAWQRPLVRRLAPGIAVAPAPGHSPGSQTILVKLQNGRELLFVGDISWTRAGITALRTRPRFLQWIMFDPDERREQVLAQLRALHDIAERNDAPVIVPSHDGAYLDRLVAEGILQAR